MGHYCCVWPTARVGDADRARGKTPSIALHLAYVYGVTFIFLPVAKYELGRHRIIHTGNYFDYVFTKEKSSLL